MEKIITLNNHPPKYSFNDDQVLLLIYDLLLKFNSIPVLQQEHSFETEAFFLELGRP
jgi:hypothetical protein